MRQIMIGHDEFELEDNDVVVLCPECDFMVVASFGGYEECPNCTVNIDVESAVRVDL